MKIKFWGVRGSIPTPGPDTIRVGGETPCVQVLTPGDDIVILDSGTGIRKLGLELEKRNNLQVHLLFTHTHWDHIQGFPFFRPLFRPDATIRIYGRPGVNANLEETLAGQMEYQYFPVQISNLQAKIEFIEMPDGEVVVNGNTHLIGQSFEHPGGVLSYRIEREGKSVVYATDVEHGNPDEKERLVQFSKGADLLILDCQFTNEEYQKNRKGWGHSTPEGATEIARLANVTRMAMFHHDPTHGDDFLETIETLTQDVFPGAFLARDGMVVEI